MSPESQWLVLLRRERRQAVEAGLGQGEWGEVGTRLCPQPPYAPRMLVECWRENKHLLIALTAGGSRDIPPNAPRELPTTLRRTPR